MPENLTTKQFVDLETERPISNPCYIGDVYDADGADAVLRLFGQDKTRDVTGRVGDYRFTDDPVLAENHLWADGSPIDPVAWPELHAYAARLGWPADAQGHFLLPDLRGDFAPLLCQIRAKPDPVVAKADQGKVNYPNLALQAGQGTTAASIVISQKSIILLSASTLMDGLAGYGYIAVEANASPQFIRHYSQDGSSMQINASCLANAGDVISLKITVQNTCATTSNPLYNYLSYTIIALENKDG